MSTHRKVLSYWTEVKRIVDGEVKVTCCCCGEPGRRNGETMAQAGWRADTATESSGDTTTRTKRRVAVIATEERMDPPQQDETPPAPSRAKRKE